MVADILQLQPSQTNDGEDTPRWIKSSDGEFSTASAYDLIVDQQNHMGDWGWIWKLKVPLKLKSFLWLVLHDKLLTNHKRATRGITNDPKCPYYVNIETIEHLLRLCPQALQICGYYGKPEICTRLEAELWAVYKGLTIILQRGFNQVIIEMDAEQVVQLLSKDIGERCPFRGIVEDARITMRGCDCTIQHIRRDANICADAMAKLGEYQPAELLIVQDPPAELRPLLVEDIVHLSMEGSRV
ncbi:uncharacterized protein LOC114272492 [Camellia sinensis]|uniref:uncharacterized protein LOC114272492 n=1 Tax=Camellia sinensis TaxID=4442 RepID=UPI0010360EBE|nr:uncharacterized protein LOC114272492 [Camellia sinensis]